MERKQIDPRPNWSQDIANIGYGFYDPAGIPGWSEDAYYELTLVEAKQLEEAANAVQRLCLSGIKKVLDEKLFPLLAIDSDIGNLITKTYGELQHPSMLGRINFVYDGVNPPKMISYNADTPNALFESAVVQLEWRKQRYPTINQFNKLHEKLIERWRRLGVGRSYKTLYVTTFSDDLPEQHAMHFMSIAAQQAGWGAKALWLDQIGWNGSRFTDQESNEIYWVYKRYPLANLVTDVFPTEPTPTAAKDMFLPSQSVWLEPIWKLLLENKAFMALLWEMFPEHPNLLPTFRDTYMGEGWYAKKPFIGRNGENVEIRDGYKLVEGSAGDYDGDFICQTYALPRMFDGYHPIFGVWMVGDEPSGLVVREDVGLITRSRVVPHLVV